jgi:hypothetical protein
MSATAETRIAQRQILLVGPYGILGTGVVDAVAANPQWGITTAARRPVGPCRRIGSTPRLLTSASISWTARRLQK